MREQCVNCKHLRELSGGCRAFPAGIPYEIASGQKIHDKVIKGQTGEYVFEKGEPYEMKEALEKAKKA